MKKKWTKAQLEAIEACAKRCKVIEDYHCTQNQDDFAQGANECAEEIRAMANRGRMEK
jgi:hypothetical protein